MAKDVKVQLKQYNGTDYDSLFPKTKAEQVITTDAQQFISKSDKDKIGSALQTSGGTMTGALTLAADPAANLEAATKQYVDGKITDLVGGAPEALDTLKELADALGNDADVAATLTNEIAKKLDKTEVSATAVANKVPQLDADGKLPAEMLPDGLSGESGTKIVVSATQPEADALKAGDFWYEIIA